MRPFACRSGFLTATGTQIVSREGTKAQNQRRKPEYRNPKLETNSNDRNTKFKTDTDSTDLHGEFFSHKRHKSHRETSRGRLKMLSPDLSTARLVLLCLADISQRQLRTDQSVQTDVFIGGLERELTVNFRRHSNHEFSAISPRAERLR